MYSQGLFCVIVLSALFCATLAAHDKILVLIPAEVVLPFRSAAKGCSEKTGVDAAMLTKVVDWSIDKNEATKEFIFCICERTGFADDEGHLQMDKMLTRNLGNGTREDYVNALTECNKINRENRYETLFAIGTCFNDNAIIKLI